MTYLYHYCASWYEDGKPWFQGGVMRSPCTVCFDNYGDLQAAIANEVGKQNITITSLSFLGIEDENVSP